MFRRPSPAALGSWIATLAVVATAGVIGRGPEQEPATIVHSAAPTTTMLPTTPATVPLSSTLGPATTSTTTASVPPTPPAPPPPPITAPAPPPTTPPTTMAPVSIVDEPAPAADPADALALLQQVVPPRWLAAVPVRIVVIPGNTSWSSWGGLIELGDWHLTSSAARARNVLAHEWGHQVAWLYGTDSYNGAPPAGFPYQGRTPEEQWADCVAEALTGTSNPTGGLGPCPGDALAFTASFFGRAPGPRLRG